MSGRTAPVFGGKWPLGGRIFTEPDTLDLVQFNEFSSSFKGSAPCRSVRCRWRDQAGGRRRGRVPVMTRRVWFVLMGALGIVLVLGAVKTMQIRAAIAEASSFQMPPEAVTTVEAKLQPWPSNLEAIGTVQAVRGVTVSADLPGFVEAILFESGEPVREGEVLVRLDARQERAQLAAA